MKNQLHLLLFLFLITNVSFAQTYQKTYGGSDEDHPRVIKKTHNGGYIISGYSRSFVVGDNRSFLLKINSVGDLEWLNYYSDSLINHSYDVIETIDSGYVFVGNIINPFTQNNIVKTDGTGNVLWSYTYNGNIAGSRPPHVLQTSDTGLVIQTGSSSLIKLNNSGFIQWSKTYTTGISDVKQTSDGGFILTGGFGPGPNNYTIALIKTDSIGDVMWAKALLPIINISSSFEHVIQTPDNGFAVLFNEIDASINKINLVKTNSTGIIQWTKQYVLNSQTIGNALINATNSDLVIGGEFENAIGDDQSMLIKLDSIGNIIWSRGFAGKHTESVVLNNDGGFSFTGEINGLNSDIYIARTNNAGVAGCLDSIVSISATSINRNDSLIIVSDSGSINDTTISILKINYTFLQSTLCIDTITSITVESVNNSNFLSVFPNPSNGRFTLSGENFINTGKITVYSALGLLIFEENISNETKKEINLKNISHGIYFVKVFDGRRYYCKKIIIQQD